jgi:hypothetical protein
MQQLRRVLIILAIIGIGISILLFKLGNGYITFAIYALIESLIILVAIFFERKRYTPPNSKNDDWIRTNERFIDHSTNTLMEVHYNPKTGERSYREVNTDEQSKESVKR